MKKFLVTLLVLIIATSAMFASFSYDLDLISFDPLHKEYLADPHRPAMGIEYASVFEGGVPTFLHQHDKLFDFSKDLDSTFLKFNVGETISLMQNTFSFDHWLSPISFDISAQLLYKILLEGSISMELGFDGVYFYGTTMNIADTVSLRFGYHHYCSHIGDKIYDAMSGNNREHLWVMQKYIRADTIALGLSVQPLDFLRVYGEVNMPTKDSISSFRPNMFAPTWREPNNAKAPHNFPSSYKALIVSTGFELEYPVFKKLGNTSFGYDLHLYEEGKIVYDNTYGGPSGGYESADPNYYYDEDRPWRAEHTIVIGQDISPMATLEVKYHNGRFLINNFFNQESTYLTFGVKLRLDGKVDLVDTDNF